MSSVGPCSQKGELEFDSDVVRPSRYKYENRGQAYLDGAMAEKILVVTILRTFGPWILLLLSELAGLFNGGKLFSWDVPHSLKNCVQPSPRLAYSFLYPVFSSWLLVSFVGALLPRAF